jgi:ADP-ribose pyrophosphatase YjhB (NUDIX family)
VPRTSQVEEPTVAVGAVVVDGAGRVLLIRRGRPPSVGSWTLPGGRVEPGETLDAAIAREVKEETAIAVRVECELCRVTIVREGYAFLVHEYLVVPLGDGTSPTPRAGDDASEARWVHRYELELLGVRQDAVAVIEQGLAEGVARGLAPETAD